MYSRFVWLLSLNIIILRFVCVGADINSPFLLTSELYCIPLNGDTIVYHSMMGLWVVSVNSIWLQIKLL